MCWRYLKICSIAYQCANVRFCMYLLTIPTSVTRLGLVVIMANIRLLTTSFHGIAFICSTSSFVAGCFPCVNFTLTFRGVFINLWVSMLKQLRMSPTYFKCLKLMVFLALSLIIWIPMQYSTSSKSLSWIHGKKPPSPY